MRSGPGNPLPTDPINEANARDRDAARASLRRSITKLSTVGAPTRLGLRRQQPHTGDRDHHVNGTSLRATVAGKFLQLGPERFWVKGVSYGTFAPDKDGQYFPPPARIAEDFGLMSRAGVNTVRTYTVPDQRLLDLAQQHGLRIMVGVPWPDHVAFLDDRRLSRAIRRDVVSHVRALVSHPAILMLALGNEIPAAVVRWLGPERVERFLSELYADAKAIAPEKIG